MYRLLHAEVLLLWLGSPGGATAVGGTAKRMRYGNVTTMRTALSKYSKYGPQVFLPPANFLLSFTEQILRASLRQGKLLHFCLFVVSKGRADHNAQQRKSTNTRKPHLLLMVSTSNSTVEEIKRLS